MLCITYLHGISVRRIAVRAMASWDFDVTSSWLLNDQRDCCATPHPLSEADITAKCCICGPEQLPIRHFPSEISGAPNR
jgi:hypothetical protein